MKCVRALALVVCLLAPAVPSRAADGTTDAFPSCATATNYNTSHQFGQFAWIEYIVETKGVFDICGEWVVKVEASVVNIANSGMSDQGWMYAVARRQIPVPVYGRTYQTNGVHFTSGTIPNIFNGGWWSNGSTTSFATPRPPLAVTGDPALDCAMADGVWRDGWCDYKASSPIIVDSARNGYSLTSVADGVRFDLDADGVPEMVAWTTRDSDDEFLAMDRNGNGRIDDGSELFGDHTPVRVGEATVTTANGFEALKFLQSASGAAASAGTVLGASDPSFGQLLLWRDANHDGISEPDELRTLASAGGVGVGLEYKEKKRVDRYGNEFRQRGTIYWQDGREFLFDVWLQSHD